jgi:hypothetical protein
VSEAEPLLDATALRRAFRQLADVLEMQGIVGHVFVVGGAAMVLAYRTRLATRDVDAVFVPKQEVRAAAERVAEELGIHHHWLNDAAKGFMPGEDPDALDLSDSPFLEISVASPRYLLAMKLLAFRDDRDIQDIVFLLERTGIETVDEALDLLEHYFPQRLLDVRTQLKLEELFAGLSERGDPPASG